MRGWKAKTAAENLAPVARFNVAPSSGPAPLTVHFDAGASSDRDGSVVTYAWDFGDGNRGTGVTATHTYEQGNYQVRLTVTDNVGTPHSTQRRITVEQAVDETAPSSPEALTQEDATTMRVHISWREATDNVGVTGYRLYRDGVLRATVSDLSFEDENLQPGTTYVYQVSAVDAAGNESPRALLEATTIAENQAPVARFSVTPSSGTAPLTVELHAGASSDADGTIATYSWDFGDGDTGTGTVATHTYGPGNYTVRLTITDDAGAQHSTQRAVTATAQLPESDNTCPAETWGGRPYPPSTVIKSITWHDGTNGTEDTLYQAAGGSDIWAATWMKDDDYPGEGSLLLAWGDGVGFGPPENNYKMQYGTGRSGLGFSQITSTTAPQALANAHNLWGGMDSENSIHFEEDDTRFGEEDKGKVGGVLAVDGKLYGWINLQRMEGGKKWPDVHHGLVWSERDGNKPAGARWKLASLRFLKGKRHLKPVTFVQYGMDYQQGLDDRLGNEHVYFVGSRQGVGGKFYMGRVEREHIREKLMYTYYAGVDSSGSPIWESDVELAAPFFRDCSIDDEGFSPPPVISYNVGLRRYIMSTARSLGGQLAIYDAPNPWGPWTTVAYEDNWLGGNGPTPLLYSFVNKWASNDGLTNWLIFSMHKTPKQDEQPHPYHDKFNMIKATFVLP